MVSVNSELRNVNFSSASGTWTLAAPPLIPRNGAKAVLLDDGRVLLVGGATTGNVTLDHAELYDPVANTWTATGAMAQPRELFGAVKLDDGRVLVAGGHLSTPGIVYRSDAELYDPATGLWGPASPMAAAAKSSEVS